jgi:hypothetical protein
MKSKCIVMFCLITRKMFLLLYHKKFPESASHSTWSFVYLKNRKESSRATIYSLDVPPIEQSSFGKDVMSLGNVKWSSVSYLERTSWHLYLGIDLFFEIVLKVNLLVPGWENSYTFLMSIFKKKTKTYPAISNLITYFSPTFDAE